MSDDSGYISIDAENPEHIEFLLWSIKKMSDAELMIYFAMTHSLDLEDYAIGTTSELYDEELEKVS